MPEEIAQPEEAIEKEEIPVQEQEGSDADHDEIGEVTAEEVPASKRQSRGKTTTAIPSRTNPGRKAKGISTPIVPIFTSSRKESPKAKRKVAFSQEKDEEQESGQAEEDTSATNQADHPAQSTTDPKETNESRIHEGEGESEAGSEEKSPVSEKSDEEMVIEGPGVEALKVDEAGAGGEMPKDDATKEAIDEREATKERERKTKAKVLSQVKIKREVRTTRRIGGPVIQEPAEHMVIESSYSSEE